MWSDLIAAIGLVLVLEGILPFASPGGFKRRIAQALEIGDRELRIAGFVALFLGVVLVYWVRS